jgi:hypothetical protein
VTWVPSKIGGAGYLLTRCANTNSSKKRPPTSELDIIDNLKLFHDAISTAVVTERCMRCEGDHKQFIGTSYEKDGRRLLGSINSSRAWSQRKPRNQIVGQDNQ